jgi:hypothetical protein
MPNNVKKPTVSCKVTPLEHSLIGVLAKIRDTTVDALLRRYGVDDLVRIARDETIELVASASSDAA